MERCWASGLGFVSLDSPPSFYPESKRSSDFFPGVLDREGNARKVVNCSCVVVRDWGEESQERSILLNYFQTEQ